MRNMYAYMQRQGQFKTIFTNCMDELSKHEVGSFYFYTQKKKNQNASTFDK